jgi:hypothetical protein
LLWGDIASGQIIGDILPGSGFGRAISTAARKAQPQSLSFFDQLPALGFQRRAIA